MDSICNSVTPAVAGVEQGRLGSRVLRMGTISYYNGDKVFDEPM